MAVSVDLRNLNRALTRFSESFDDDILYTDIAPRLTCREVDAVASVLAALGEGGRVAAARWVEAHAKTDEEDDDHYQLADVSEYLDSLFWD